MKNRFFILLATIFVSSYSFAVKDSPSALTMDKDSMNECCEFFKKEVLCCESLTDACAHNSKLLLVGIPPAAVYSLFYSLEMLEQYLSSTGATCFSIGESEGWLQSEDRTMCAITTCCALCGTLWISCCCGKCYGKGGLNHAYRQSTHED